MKVQPAWIGPSSTLSTRPSPARTLFVLTSKKYPDDNHSAESQQTPKTKQTHPLFAARQPTRRPTTNARSSRRKRANVSSHEHPYTRTMSYFRITLMRSGIGLPLKTQGVLKALGLRKRMTTVYHPVSQSVAGQIMRIKELVDVKEVSEARTKDQIRAARRPDPGYYVEQKAGEAMRGYE